MDRWRDSLRNTEDLGNGPDLDHLNCFTIPPGIELWTEHDSMDVDPMASSFVRGRGESKSGRRRGIRGSRSGRGPLNGGSKQGGSNITDPPAAAPPNAPPSGRSGQGAGQTNDPAAYETPERAPHLTTEINGKADAINLIYTGSGQSLAWRKPYTIDSFMRSARQLYSNFSTAPKWPEADPTLGIMYVKDQGKVIDGPIPGDLGAEYDAWESLRKAVQDADSPRIHVLKLSVQESAAA